MARRVHLEAQTKQGPIGWTRVPLTEYNLGDGGVKKDNGKNSISSSNPQSSGNFWSACNQFTLSTLIRMPRVKAENPPRHYVEVVCPHHPSFSHETIQVTAQRAKRATHVGICHRLVKHGLPCLGEKLVLRVFTK